MIAAKIAAYALIIGGAVLIAAVDFRIGLGIGMIWLGYALGRPDYE